MSLSLANPIAFLAAGGGYLGHALLTFREETGGQQFARRWLCCSTWSTSALRPAAMPKAPTLVLVFTPTVLNALIWSRPRFACVAEARPSPPLRHADDRV